MEQQGMIIARSEVHRAARASHQRGAYRVASWQDGVAPKTRAAFYQFLQRQGLYSESVYSRAGHLLLVYRNASERAAAFAALPPI